MEIGKPEMGFMGQLTTKNIFDDINFAVKNKFEWFEIALDWKQNFNLSDSKIKKIRKISEKNGLKLIVHTPYFLPTSSMIPEVRESVIRYMKKSIIFAKKVGADRLTVHPGYREMPETAIKQSTNSLIKNLKEIVKMGKKYGIVICLENLDNVSTFMCIEPNHYMKVLKSVKGLKSTLDIGHTNTSKTNTLVYFKTVKKLVMDMHVHDNDGVLDTHSVIGKGNIDFKKLLAQCKKAGYSGPFTLELFPYKNILEGRKRFIKIWNSI
jgi:sugar phosphate isomerase/epimerase